MVELLCAMLLGTVIAGSSIAILSAEINSYQQELALTEARRRGQMVIQILRLPVENATLGIPASPTEYKGSFSIGKASLPSVSYWEGPVSVSGNELRLVYAMPTSIVNETGAVPTYPSEDRYIRLSSTPQTGQVSPWSGVGASGTRSWVVFAPSRYPFLVTGLNNRTLALRSHAPSWVPHNASLHYLRAMRAVTLRFPGQEPSFYTEDVSTGSGLQERVNGIAGFKAGYDRDSHILTIHVLSRGGKRSEGLISPSSLPGWPGSVGNEDRHFRLVVSTWTCKVRNGGAENKSL